MPAEMMVEGSGTVAGLGVPVMNVSGLVPKEKIAEVTVVSAVTPPRFKVNVAGPITNGLKF